MLTALISAIVIAPPTFLYAWIVSRIDRFEKEPLKYRIGAFLWGAIPAVILALIFSLIFSLPVVVIFGDESQATSLITGAIIAPLIEEIAKGLVIAIVYFWRRREFDGWIDGIVYGSLVGFGFAYTENILYLSSAENAGAWVSMFIFRVLVLGFLHGFFSSFVGIGFGLARKQRNDFVKALLIATGLALAMAAHAIHNATMTLAQNTEGISVCIGLLNYVVLISLSVALGIIGNRNERNLIKTHLAEEVPAVLSQKTYDALCGSSPAARDYLNQVPKRKHSVLHVAAELAQKKQQLQLHPEDVSVATEIAQLRTELLAFFPAPPAQPPVVVSATDVAAPSAPAARPS
jgi:RsiW-degrading membrane proteinase PrsW (M82 family)